MLDSLPTTDPEPAPGATGAPALRVLILMSRTGGGHLASARALQAEFEAQRPGVEVTIVDLLTDHISDPFSRLAGTYDTVVTRAPRLYHAMWRASTRSGIARPAAALVRHLSRRRLKRLILAARPDIVVSVHPLVNHLVVPVLRRLSPATRYVTVVTDLGTIHPLWLHPQSAAIYLPTERALDMAVARGLPRDRLHVLGLPVRAEFAARPAVPEEARAAFGLDPDLPVILVMGGGGGIGPIEAIVGATAQALVRHGAKAQIAVVCAKNARLRAALGAGRWPVPVIALGYVEAMSDLMHASDILITKAGPGTIAEASICGLPMALYGYIPGQEEANVDHVVEAGAGLFEPDVDRLAEAVAALMTGRREEREAMAGKARALGRAQATRDIVASILAGASR